MNCSIKFWWAFFEEGGDPFDGGVGGAGGGSLGSANCKLGEKRLADRFVHQLLGHQIRMGCAAGDIVGDLMGSGPDKIVGDNFMNDSQLIRRRRANRLSIVEQPVRPAGSDSKSK